MSLLNPYIEFCSQLINNHLRGVPNDTLKDEIALPREILAVDIKNSPATFVKHMSKVVSHMVIESACMDFQKFLVSFNPSTQQNNVLLREVCYAVVTAREILTRLLG